MATLSVIMKSTAEETSRLDAEHYHPKYLQSLQTIRRFGYFTLKDALSILYRYPTFYDLEYRDTGVLVLKGEDIEDSGLVDSKHSNHISVEASSKFPKTILKAGDIILSVRGYVGKVGLIDSEIAGSQISPNLIRLEINRTKVNPYFLWLFLNTCFGQSQLERAKMQTSQETILAGDIKSILIPNVGKDKQVTYEGVIKEAIKVFRESKALYLQAEQLLLAELGLDKLDLSQTNYCTIPLSQAQKVNRMDAEHFQPKYDRLFQHIAKRGNADYLRNLVNQPIKRGLQPIYAEEGKVIVVNSQHLGRYLLNIEATERTDDTFWKSNKQCQVQRNDVLFYSTGAYIGRTNAWLEDLKAIASNHVTIIRPNATCNPLYLSVYLNALPGLMQAQRWASGSGQQEIYPKDIARFIVYLPLMEFQQHIADLVTHSWQARQKATNLLEEAKRKVEEAVQAASA